jgi:hypothetical protein
MSNTEIYQEFKRTNKTILIGSLIAAVALILVSATATSNLPLFSTWKADGVAIYHTFLGRDRE